MARVTTLNINGKKTAVDVDSAVMLLSVLRDSLDFTGTKYGCGEGQCGACTVLLDGQPTRSCITQVGRAAGKEITTIEGLEKDGKLSPLQEAFIKADAMQCAYCTSGMILSASALLAKTPRPNRDQIVEGMNRNICRCGVYQRIIEAIQIASGQQVAGLGPQASPPAVLSTDGVDRIHAGGDACAPSTNAPSTNAPSTNAPSTNAPSTNAPSTNAPSTNAPSTNAPSANAPSTNAPSTNAPSTNNSSES